MLDERMARCRSVLPLCEQIIRLQFVEKAHMHNLPMDATAHCVVEDIQDYNHLGGMWQSDVIMQIYAPNQFSALQNKAIMALLRLHAFGITDDEILNVYQFLNRARLESAAKIQR